MKNLLRKPLRWGVCLILAGFVLTMADLAILGFNPRRLDTVHYQRKTETVSDRFESLSILAVSHDVRLLPSEDGSCQVVYDESEQTTFAIEVKHGTLSVHEKNIAKWYNHIGVFFSGDTPELTLYLPARQYRALALQTTSGNILVDESFSFHQAELRSTSGDIAFSSAVAEKLSLINTSGDIKLRGIRAGSIQADTTSGEIDLTDITAKGDARFKAVSGDIVLKQVSAGSTSVQTTSGEIRLENGRTGGLNAASTSGDIGLIATVAAGPAKLETVSGEIRFDRFDAASLDIRTVSGNAEGSLLSGKIFDYSTTSGSIRVPHDDPDGGRFYAKTTSGDVEIEIIR